MPLEVIVTQAPISEWIDYVKGFQALIVGVLGFAGVILSMLYNGKQARELSKNQRKEEQESLLSALRAELTFKYEYLQEFAAQMEWDIKNPTNCNVRIPKTDNCPVYESNVHGIGLLPANKAKLLIRLYSQFQNLDERLLTLQVWSGCASHDDKAFHIKVGNFSDEARNNILKHCDFIENSVSRL